MSNLKYNNNKNVLEATRERINFVFDKFETIIVSISGGKDSTVLAHLALSEAHKRGRKIGLFYLDEEAVYDATIKQVEYLMSLYPENTVRYWFQFEFNLTNSVDIGDGQFHCWEQGKRKDWIHPRDKRNVLKRTWTHETKIACKEKGFGFYDVIENFEMSFKNAAFLVGLRADESLNRRRAVIKKAGYENILWSTQKGENFTFYPLYDWAFSDIWKYIGEQKLRYHRYYDIAFLRGVPLSKMRVSSLCHEKSFSAIQDLPEFEPNTYERLLKRAKGISFAQETAKDGKMFRCRKLPKNFKKWSDYRDFLLATYPDASRVEIFRKRFSKHPQSENIARQQCRQLILNDYENNLPVDIKAELKLQETIEYWKNIL